MGAKETSGTKRVRSIGTNKVRQKRTSRSKPRGCRARPQRQDVSRNQKTQSGGTMTECGPKKEEKMLVHRIKQESVAGRSWYSGG